MLADTRLEAGARVGTPRATEICATRNQQVIAREAEACVPAIRDRTQLALIDQSAAPYIGGRLRCQVETEVAILIHRNLALAELDPMFGEQTLDAGQPLLIDDAGQPVIARAISNAGGTSFFHVDLVTGGPAERLDEAVEAGGFAGGDASGGGALRESEILGLAALFRYPGGGPCAAGADLALGVELGLRYRRTQKPVGISTIHHMLRNRLYAGAFEWAGRLHQGTHDAIITRETW